MPRKSTRPPTQDTMPPTPAGGVQVSWSDADTVTLIDLVAAHKASAGEGLNFKTAFWNGVAAKLENPSKGAPKTAKACKDKWKRLKKTYDAVDQLCRRSGFAYSPHAGANVGIENEHLWNNFVREYKDAAPFRNKGWPYYEKMKEIMPSKAKGLNRFSALSIVEPHPSEHPSVEISTSESESRDGSVGTVGGPSAEGGVPGVSGGFPVVETDAVMTFRPLQQPADAGAPSSVGPSKSVIGTLTGFPHVITPASFPHPIAPASFPHPIAPARFPYPAVPPYAASSVGSAQATSVASASTQVPFSWRSDSSPPGTSASFPPPSAPSSFAGSNISSIKPSSSISNRMEKSLKRKADDDNYSVVSGSLSSMAPTSTSSARKRHAGKSDAIDAQFEKFGSMCESISDSGGYLREVVSAMDAKSKGTKAAAVPTHPVVHLARQKLIELDKTTIPARDMILLFGLFRDNRDFADGYVQLTTDPELVDVRRGWLQQGLEDLKRSS